MNGTEAAGPALKISTQHQMTPPATAKPAPTIAVHLTSVIIRLSPASISAIPRYLYKTYKANNPQKMEKRPIGYAAPITKVRISSQEAKNARATHSWNALDGVIRFMFVSSPSDQFNEFSYQPNNQNSGTNRDHHVRFLQRHTLTFAPNCQATGRGICREVDNIKNRHGSSRRCYRHIRRLRLALASGT
jgi:hypothetical protein